MREIYQHFRYDKDGVCRPYHRNGKNRSNWAPMTKGGKTVCTLVDGQGAMLAQGVAMCSLDDSFNYRLGRLISCGRAKKKLR
jgi:hypothetical protein